MRGWLFAATFVTLATALFGVVWSTALVVASVAWIWSALGLALAGLLGLIFVVGVGAIGTISSRIFQSATTTLSLFCVSFIAIRFVHPFYPTVGAIGFFCLSYALAFGSMGSFLEIIDTVAPIMRCLPLNGQLLVTGFAGQLVGAVGGILGFYSLPPGAAMLLTFLGSLVAAILLSVLAMRRQPHIRLQISRAEQVIMGETLRKRYSLVTTASITGFLGFGLLAQGLYLVYRLMQSSVRLELGDWGVLFFALFGCAAVVAAVALGLSRRWLWRYGAFGLILLYPCLMLIPLIWWFLEPRSLAAAFMTALFHFAFLPSLFLPTLRYSLTPIPRRFLAGSSLIASGLSGALGLFAGGISWFLLSPYITQLILVRTTAVLNLGLIGFSVGLALSYRWHWISRLRTLPWHFDARFRERSGPTRIRELLSDDDPTAVELGLALVLESEDSGSYLQQIETLLQTYQPLFIRTKLLALLGKLSNADLHVLLRAAASSVRARALLATLHFLIPIPLDRLSALLQDSSPWVRVVACIAAWRLGLEELAAVAWNNVSLATIGSEELVETCDVIGPGLSASALVALIAFTDHPGAQVKAAAFDALAKWIFVHPIKEPLLWERATTACASNDPQLRKEGLCLLSALDPAGSVKTCANLLQDSQEMVRIAAAEGLARAGQQGVELATEALEVRGQENNFAAILALIHSGPAGNAVVERYLERLYTEVRAQLPQLNAGMQEAAQADDAYLGLLRRFAWVAELRGELSVGLALKALADFGPDWSQATTGTLWRWIVPNPLLTKASRLYQLRSKFPTLVQ